MFRWSLFAIRSPLFAIRSPLFAIRSPLFAIRSSLFASVARSVAAWCGPGGRSLLVLLHRGGVGILFYLVIFVDRHFSSFLEGLVCSCLPKLTSSRSSWVLSPMQKPRARSLWSLTLSPGVDERLGHLGPSRRARFSYDDLLLYFEGPPLRWTARGTRAARLVTRAGDNDPIAHRLGYARKVCL